MATQRTFALDISKFVEKAKDEADKTIREACFEVTRRVILKTPVDTGRARANWQASVSTPVEGVKATNDKGGGASIAAAGGAVSQAPGKVFWLTNNLPYAAALELGLYPNPAKTGTKTKGGFSTQAPAGMARISVEEVHRLLSR